MYILVAYTAGKGIQGWCKILDTVTCSTSQVSRQDARKMLESGITIIGMGLFKTGIVFDASFNEMGNGLHERVVEFQNKGIVYTKYIRGRKQRPAWSWYDCELREKVARYYVDDEDVAKGLRTVHLAMYGKSRKLGGWCSLVCKVFDNVYVFEVYCDGNKCDSFEVQRSLTINLSAVQRLDLPSDKYNFCGREITFKRG